jgi:choline dehydrogenase-like flavoprotein
VLAARLSEEGGAGVLLLEAGDREPLRTAPPTWPNPAGDLRRLGRHLGGAGVERHAHPVAARARVRGHLSSCDAWAVGGARGWGFDDLLPYLRRCERVEGRDPAVRGMDGPLTIGRHAAQPVPATVFSHGDLVGLVRSSDASDAPDLQIQVLDIPYSLLPTSQTPPGQGYSIAFSAIAPRSRGSVRLVDAQPGTAPLLDPNYSADPHDVEAMTAGLRVAREIGRASALEPWRGHEVLPGPDVRDHDSVRDYLHKSLRTYAHRTCRIGTDDMAVVDVEL